MKELVEKIHNAGKQFSIALTGGGSMAISELLRYGGASKTILDIFVPYSQDSLTKFLGKNPEKSCSEQTARDMAIRTYVENRIGFGITASLSKSDQRQDRINEMFIAGHSDHKTDVRRFDYTNLLTREIQEKFASEAILKFIFDFINKIENIAHNPVILKEQKSNFFDIFRKKELYILSGSFNPIHEKHLEMAEFVYKKTNQRVFLEISMKNVDKPSVDHIEIDNRICSIVAKNHDAIAGVYVTRAPYFTDKINALPKATYLVGYDTIWRIANHKYYDPITEWEIAINKIVDSGSKFLVFHRKGINIQAIKNSFHEAVGKLITICEFVPITEFEDTKGISSTEIRKFEELKKRCFK